MGTRSRIKNKEQRIKNARTAEARCRCQSPPLPLAESAAAAARRCRSPKPLPLAEAAAAAAAHADVDAGAGGGVVAGEQTAGEGVGAWRPGGRGRCGEVRDWGSGGLGKWGTGGGRTELTAKNAENAEDDPCTVKSHPVEGPAMSTLLCPARCPCPVPLPGARCLCPVPVPVSGAPPISYPLIPSTHSLGSRADHQPSINHQPSTCLNNTDPCTPPQRWRWPGMAPARAWRSRTPSSCRPGRPRGWRPCSGSWTRCTGCRP